MGELAVTPAPASLRPVRRAIEIFASPRGTPENDLRVMHKSVRQVTEVGEAEALRLPVDRGKDGFHGAITGDGQAPERAAHGHIADFWNLSLAADTV